MDDKDKKPMSKSEAQSKLKQANEEYTNCLSKNFIGKFLNGERVYVEQVCVKERDTMMQLDQLVYGKLGLIWEKNQNKISYEERHLDQFI